jgi:hypothetical protein
MEVNGEFVSGYIQDLQHFLGCLFGEAAHPS